MPLWLWGCKELALPSAPTPVLDESLYLTLFDRSGREVIGGDLSISNRAYVSTPQQEIRREASVAANGVVRFDGLRGTVFDVRFVPSSAQRDSLEIRYFHRVRTGRFNQDLQYPPVNVEAELVLPGGEVSGTLNTAWLRFRRNGVEFEQSALPDPGPRMRFAVEPGTYVWDIGWRFDRYDGSLRITPGDSLRLPTASLLRIEPDLVPLTVDVHAGPRTLPTARILLGFGSPAGGTEARVTAQYWPLGSERLVELWAPRGAVQFGVRTWDSLVAFFPWARFVEVTDGVFFDVDVGTYQLIVRAQTVAGIPVVGAMVTIADDLDPLLRHTGALGESVFFVDADQYIVHLSLPGFLDATTIVVVDQDRDVTVILQEAP